MRDQTEAYRASEDTVAAFLAERCVTGPGMSARGGALYEAFKGWCASTGARAVRPNDFSAEITGRGFERKTTNAGAVYHGIGVRQDERAEAGAEWGAS